MKKLLLGLSIISLSAVSVFATTIEISPSTFDFGWAPDNAKISGEFTIKNTLGESVVALGIVPNGIPFGAPDGKLTSVFFLVCCVDDKTHLQVLARLTRLFRREGFLDALRDSTSQADLWHLIRQTELSLMLPS